MPPSLSINYNKCEVQNQPNQVDPSLGHKAEHYYLVHLSHHISVTNPRQRSVLDHRIYNPNRSKQVRGMNVSYMNPSLPSEDCNNFLFYSSQFLPPSFSSFVQNAIIWSVCNLYNIRGQNLQLKASNNALKGSVVFVSRSKGAIE